MAIFWGWLFGELEQWLVFLFYDWLSLPLQMLEASWLSVCVLFEFMSVVSILFLFGALCLLWIVISDVFRLGFCLVIAFMYRLFVWMFFVMVYKLGELIFGEWIWLKVGIVSLERFGLEIECVRGNWTLLELRQNALCLVREFWAWLITSSGWNGFCVALLLAESAWRRNSSFKVKLNSFMRLTTKSSSSLLF